jgi:hypothetical protein
MLLLIIGVIMCCERHRVRVQINKQLNYFEQAAVCARTQEELRRVESSVRLFAVKFCSSEYQRGRKREILAYIRGRLQEMLL